MEGAGDWTGFDPALTGRGDVSGGRASGRGPGGEGSAASVIGNGSMRCVGTSACAGDAAVAGAAFRTIVTGSWESGASDIADGGTSIGRPLAWQNSRRFWALVVTNGSSAGRVRAAIA